MHVATSASPSRSSLEGLVIRKTIGHYTVRVETRSYLCTISNRLRKELVYPIAAPASIRPHVVIVEDIRVVDPVAVGDRVHFTDAGDGTGVIAEVLPRRTRLSRLASGPKPLEQVIVANLDQVVPIFAAAQPAPKWAMLDRYLVTAESFDVPAVIVITKTDLVDERAIRRDLREYERIGYRILFTSAESNDGIEEAKKAFQGKVSVLLGKSGVGKSTLLNAMQPGLGLRVNAVSDSTGKGKHTTTVLEMFDLDFGGSVVDTPGMREFGLWDVDGSDVAGFFREMRPYLGKCQYGADCSHAHEPGCAVKQAVAKGEITQRRYDSYRKLR